MKDGRIAGVFHVCEHDLDCMFTPGLVSCRRRDPAGFELFENFNDAIASQIKLENQSDVVSFFRIDNQASALVICVSVALSVIKL